MNQLNRDQLIDEIIKKIKSLREISDNDESTYRYSLENESNERINQINNGTFGAESDLCQMIFSYALKGYDFAKEKELLARTSMNLKIKLTAEQKSKLKTLAQKNGTSITGMTRIFLDNLVVGNETVVNDQTLETQDSLESNLTNDQTTVYANIRISMSQEKKNRINELAKKRGVSTTTLVTAYLNDVLEHTKVLTPEMSTNEEPVASDEMKESPVVTGGNYPLLRRFGDDTLSLREEAYNLLTSGSDPIDRTDPVLTRYFNELSDYGIEHIIGGAERGKNPADSFSDILSYMTSNDLISSREMQESIADSIDAANPDNLKSDVLDEIEKLSNDELKELFVIPNSLERSQAVTDYLYDKQMSLGRGETNTRRRRTRMERFHSGETASATPGIGTPTPDSEPITPDPGTPAPDAEPITPDPGTPAPDAEPITPDPGTPAPDAEPITPDPGTPTPDADPITPDPGTPTPDAEPITPDPGTPAPTADPITPDPGTPVPDADPITPDPGTPAPTAEPITPDPGTPAPTADPITPDPGTPAPTADPIIPDPGTPTIDPTNSEFDSYLYSVYRAPINRQMELMEKDIQINMDFYNNDTYGDSIQRTSLARARRADLALSEINGSIWEEINKLKTKPEYEKLKNEWLAIIEELKEKEGLLNSGYLAPETIGKVSSRVDELKKKKGSLIPNQRLVNETARKILQKQHKMMKKVDKRTAKACRRLYRMKHYLQQEADYIKRIEKLRTNIELFNNQAHYAMTDKYALKQKVKATKKRLNDVKAQLRTLRKKMGKLRRKEFRRTIPEKIGYFYNDLSDEDIKYLDQYGMTGALREDLNETHTTTPVSGTPAPAVDPITPDPGTPAPTVDPITPDPGTPAPTVDPIIPDPGTPSPTVDPITPDPGTPAPTVDPITPDSGTPAPTDEPEIQFGPQPLVREVQVDYNIGDYTRKQVKAIGEKSGFRTEFVALRAAPRVVVQGFSELNTFMANRRKDRDKSSESLKDKLNHLKQSGKIYMDGLSRIWKNVQVAVDNQQFDDIASKMKI